MPIENDRTVASLGAISEGTMRLEDLIPTLLSELDSLREERSFGPDSDVSKHGREDDILGKIEGCMAADGYFESDEASEDFATLCDMLQEFAPEDAYFGTLEGDGACYGFFSEHAPEGGNKLP